MRKLYAQQQHINSVGVSSNNHKKRTSVYKINTKTIGIKARGRSMESPNAHLFLAEDHVNFVGSLIRKENVLNLEMFVIM